MSSAEQTSVAPAPAGELVKAIEVDVAQFVPEDAAVQQFRNLEITIGYHRFLCHKECLFGSTVIRTAIECETEKDGRIALNLTPLFPHPDDFKMLLKVLYDVPYGSVLGSPINVDSVASLLDATDKLNMSQIKRRIESQLLGLDVANESMLTLVKLAGISGKHDMIKLGQKIVRAGDRFGNEEKNSFWFWARETTKARHNYRPTIDQIKLLALAPYAQSDRHGFMYQMMTRMFLSA